MRVSAALATFLLSACAALSPFERAQVQMRRFDSAPPGYSPIADASYRGWRDPHWEILSFFQVEDGEIVVRRVEGDRSRRTGTTWASSRQCPAVLASVQEMSMIEMPIFNYPMPDSGEGEDERAIILTADGAAINVRMDGRYDRADGYHMGVDYSVGGNVDSPAGIWFEATQERLSNCWRATAPVPSQ